MNIDPTRFPIEKALDRLHEDIGHRRLNKLWAKIEILFGLLATGGGLLLGVWAVARAPDLNLEFVIASLVLFTLGGYLALAGNRSHLYQSNNRLIAHLAELIRQSNSKD